VQPPDSLDGQSLVPLLKDPQGSTGRVVLTSFDPGNVSLRSLQWRYIRYADETEEFYDLMNDPNEWANLAGKTEHEKLLKQFRAQIPSAAIK
jgi:hypothetical protein